MILVGVIVNAVNGAIFLLVHYLTRRFIASGQSGDALAFIVGAFNTNLTPEQKRTAAVCVFAGIAMLLYMSGSLAVAGLGDSEAQALGLRVQRVRWISMIVASLVTASAVAVSGPIGFVGLICPHLARLCVGSDVRKLPARRRRDRSRAACDRRCGIEKAESVARRRVDRLARRAVLSRTALAASNANDALSEVQFVHAWRATDVRDKPAERGCPESSDLRQVLIRRTLRRR